MRTSIENMSSEIDLITNEINNLIKERLNYLRSNNPEYTIALGCPLDIDGVKIVAIIDGTTLGS